jgi:hypothetical protein
LNVRATKYIAHARGAGSGDGAMTGALDDIAALKVSETADATGSSEEGSSRAVGAEDIGEAVEEMVVDEASIGSAIAPLRRKMHELFALGNYTDALVVAHNILEAVPDDVEAVGTCRRAVDALEKIFLSKISALEEPLEIRMTAEEAVWLNLTPLEAEVFAQIDGTTPLNDFLPAAAADRLDALRFLARMSEDGAIGVPGRQTMKKR